jgi:hypothetical protein
MRVNVVDCQRCGETHEMVFQPLANAIDEWQFWGMCPITAQPVLLAVIEDCQQYEGVSALDPCAATVPV